MNMQALMKQAQAMQKDINKIKNELDSTTFIGKSSFVTVEFLGNKEFVSIKISDEGKELIADDLSMLEDMITVAINDALKQIDRVTEEKMGKYSNLMSGLM